MHRIPLLATGLAFCALQATSPAHSEELKDLYFGEALYFAHQGDWFAALERLDAEVQQHEDVDEPERDSLWYHIDDAEFSLGDFELRYRMHHRAGRAIRAVLEGAVDEEVRNDAAYRLAKIHFEKGQTAEALRALDRISGTIPEGIRDDIEFLRASVWLAEGRWPEAQASFRRLENSPEYGAYAAYNLGIAHLQAGERQLAVELLDRAGQFKADDPAELAIRDKANLVLGTLLLEAGDHLAAAPYLDRVRLDGPFSNQALLSAGWANLSLENFQRAVVPWSILSQRELTDAATQEAKLALPYAYGKLELHGRAAVYYGQALDDFGAEIERLAESIDSIRDGRFLQALAREEMRQDKDWVIRLRSLPEAPETYYLMELLATHEFQTGLSNYLDLSDLRARLVAWQRSFDAFDDMVSIRHEHYEPLLPVVDTRFRELDARLRLRTEQHRILVRRRDDLLTAPRPEFLASREEQVILAQLDAMDASLGDGELAGEKQALRARISRLRGVVGWKLHTEYHARLTEFDRNLRSLDAAMAIAKERYEQYVRSRQAASHSYEGYTDPIRHLRTQVAQSLERVDSLMKRQGHELEVVAIDELTARRGRLETYRDKARFALADSYDRATQAQARSALE